MKITFGKKLLMAFIGYGILLSAVSFFTLNSINKSNVKSSSIKNASKKAIEISMFFDYHIKNIQIKLDAVNKSKFFNSFLQNKTNIKDVNELFLSIAKTSSDIMQLRYLDNSGQEIIRVDRKSYGKEPSLVKKDKLQNKSNRYYFHDILAKNANEIWYSRIDLNRERGKIEMPLNPVIRVGFPVFKDSKKDGILIINIFMDKFLQELKKSAFYEIFLIDKDGHFIVHSLDKYNWSKYLKTSFLIQNQFPQEYKNILNTNEYIGDTVYSKKINLDNGEDIKIILHPKSLKLQEQMDQQMHNLLFMMIGLMLLSIPFAYIFSQTPAKLKEQVDELNDTLEDRIKQKTLSLEEANEELNGEKRRLTTFNKYLSGLNSVDIGFLADRSIKQILDIAEAQVGVFYIYDNETKKLKPLAKHSIDKELLKSKFFNISNGGIVQDALNTKKWQYIHGLDSDVAPTIDLGLYQTKLKHIKAIPLIFNKIKIGVILLGSVSQALKEEKYLRGYISVLIQSLSNANSYIEIQKYSTKQSQINMELERSNRLKSEFLANMSHELRTPLNSIIGFSNILQKNKPKNLLDKQIDQLEKINRNGMHLLELINNILDLSKIESGKMDADLRDIDIVDTIKSTIELLAFQANIHTKELIFTNSLGKTFYSYKTDEQKLKQVLINLVGNAIKFVEEDKGKVEVNLYEDNGILKISVKDNGIGIHKDKFESIFDAFTQSDGSTTRKFGGTGLGLTISKNMLEILGGYIDIDSKLGVGSTFTICLPITQDLISSKTQDDFKIAFQQKIKIIGDIESVLIIDDSTDSQDLLKEYLQDNYTIYSALDGKQGIELAKKYKPSLITLDIMMPELNGWEVLKRLKAATQTKDIPVILISNVANQTKGDALGAIDTLSKPVSKSDLQGVINKYFIHSECKNILVVDDEKDVRDLIRDYLDEDIQHIKDASDGKIALDIINNGYIPDLIYLDLMMPNLSGLEFLEISRTKPELKDTKIVVITAKELTNEDMDILHRNNVSIIKKGGNIEAVIREYAKGI